MIKKFIYILILIMLFPFELLSAGDSLFINKVYKIGLPSVPGLMFRNKNDEPKGLVLEVLEQILKEENIQYEWVDGNWHNLYHKLQNNEIDLLPGTIVSDSRKLIMDYCEQNLYLIWSEVFIAENTDYYHIQDFSGKKIAMVKDDYNAIGFDDYIRDFHIEYEKIYFESHEEAAFAVKSGEAFGMTGPNPNVLENIFVGLKRSGLYFNPNYLTYAFPKDKNKELKAIIDKKLIEYKNNPNSIYNTLINTYRISHISPNEPFIPKWILNISVILIFIIIGSWIFVFLLRRQVNKQTAEIKANEHTLRNALKMGRMGTWDLNLVTYEILRSNELLDILKFDGKKMLFSKIEMMSSIHPDDTKDAQEFIDEIVTKGILISKDLRMLDTNGDIIYTTQIGYLVKDSNNKPIKIIGITKDISDHKKIENELIAAKERAIESERLKSAFLANMSHEIRTPLNAIVGFSNLIAKEEVSIEESKMFKDIIIQQNDLLLNLINDIIDFAKIEAGTIDINIKQVNNLPSVIDDVYNLFKHKSTDKVIITKSHGKVFRGCNVNIDINRVKQILNNFVTNSLKFTKSGTIEIGCRFNPISEKIELFVKDSGIGIPKDKLNTIFERFTQLDNFSQGTGLGLSISKYLAERMNCEIIVDSEVGKGTEFAISITPDDDQASHNNIIEEPRIEYLSDNAIRKILIAEDVESNYTLIKNYLKHNNYALIWVKTGLDAVNAFQNDSFNLVLMDIKMPEMDGLEATRIIRKSGNKLPIIALTAYALSSDRDNAISAGCDDLIAKPVDKNELLNKLKEYLS